VTALATNSSTNSSAEVHTPVNVNVPPLAERTCDFNATKPTGCTVPKLGAFGPYALAVLVLSLAAAGGLRRRRGR
jgi:MYXO-CTERM domain-containing protein